MYVCMYVFIDRKPGPPPKQGVLYLAGGDPAARLPRSGQTCSRERGKGPRVSKLEDLIFGQGQLGSALVGSLRIRVFFVTGTCWVLPLILYSYSQKCQGVFFPPNLSKLSTFAAAPLVLTPFIRSQDLIERVRVQHFPRSRYFGRLDNTIGNPHRAQISQVELFEIIILLKLGKQLSVEQFEATVSQSTVSSPRLSTGARRIGRSTRSDKTFVGPRAELCRCLPH